MGQRGAAAGWLSVCSLAAYLRVMSKCVCAHILTRALNLRRLLSAADVMEAQHFLLGINSIASVAISEWG